MNIKRLFEKTSTGLKEFVAKVDFANVIGLGEELTKYLKRNSNVYIAEINPDINFDDVYPVIEFVYGDGSSDCVILDLASEEFPGLMTADDKVKLDNIETTYLPLSGGKMTGTLDIDFIEGIQIIEHHLSPRNTYIGNGSIRIESLDGYTTRVNSKTEIDSNSITTTNVTVTNKVKANGFLANNNGNGNTAWTTNGGSIDLINLLKNAAIYVAGGFERVGANVNNTTVIDNPDNIIFSRTGTFLAKKDSVYYTHWKADISKNIASTSRYGIETDNGVVPFNNQMYKFIDKEDIYIAICINGSCSMQTLNLE